jgi:predicted DNA-binding transcriptional regulator AlpA
LSAAILIADTTSIGNEGRNMPTITIGPEKFRAEAERRLIDSFDLMNLLGLRSKQAIWKRVESGKLPPPVYSRPNITALWDRDEIEVPD